MSEILYTNYRSHGSGPPALLLHGMAASLNDWQFITPALAEAGYCAYALDLLGHGDSAKPPEPEAYHIESLVRHFTQWVESLEIDQPPVLIGHSLGGWLSLHYALHHPGKVRALVLIAPFYTRRQLSPFLRMARRRPRLGELFLRGVPEWAIHTALRLDPASANVSPQARRQIATDYKRASPKIFNLTRNFKNLTAQAERVNVPSLVIWGEKDQTLHPASFPSLVQTLPLGRGFALPHCGHQPHLSHPQQVSRIILNYLDELDGKKASLQPDLPARLYSHAENNPGQ